MVVDEFESDFAYYERTIKIMYRIITETNHDQCSGISDHNGIQYIQDINCYWMS